MADVFLSYNRAEREAVQKVATFLSRLGLKIWFDRSLRAGDQFSEEIDRELQLARAVVVCWSPAAVQSEWVKAEAMKAFGQRKLAACQVGGPGELSLPVPFNTLHAEDLRSWLDNPSDNHSGWKSILRRVGQLCDREDIASWGAWNDQSETAELRRWIQIHKTSPLFLVADQALREREKEDERRSQLEKEAHARNTESEAILIALQKRKEADRQARDKAEKEAKEREERRKRSIGSLIVGSIFAAPIFFVVYTTIGALAFVGILILQWLHLGPGGGITRMAELVAAGMSAYFGVQASRSAIGALLAAWSGWPTFLLFIAAWVGVFYFGVTHSNSSTTWWLFVVGGVHCVVGFLAAYAWIARKGEPA